MDDTCIDPNQSPTTLPTIPPSHSKNKLLKLTTEHQSSILKEIAPLAMDIAMKLKGDKIKSWHAHYWATVDEWDQKQYAQLQIQFIFLLETVLSWRLFCPGIFVTSFHSCSTFSVQTLWCFNVISANHHGAST